MHTSSPTLMRRPGIGDVPLGGYAPSTAPLQRRAAADDVKALFERNRYDSQQTVKAPETSTDPVGIDASVTLQVGILG